MLLTDIGRWAAILAMLAGVTILVDNPANLYGFRK
jgi:hypothetical protein